MTIFRPELAGAGSLPDLPLKITHPSHMVSKSEDFLAEGGRISELTNKTGAGAVLRSGTFADVMLNALDKVSARQQFSSKLTEQAMIDPDSVDIHDITIAQAEAAMSLNIARNVLNRVVQGWRDLINTR
jgi:flagellar hook-basal body complex protein FliE